MKTKRHHENENNDSDDICGETMDHRLRRIDDGVYECLVCGAEIIDEEEQISADKLKRPEDYAIRGGL